MNLLLSRTLKSFAALSLLILSGAVFAQTMLTETKNSRPRAREIGLKIGVLPTGALNAITDVAGVRVGHATVFRGENVRTGVTAVLPHGGNLFAEKVPGAVFVGNGFGKLMGSTQVNELGEIETPILLTSTLSVPRTADFLLDYMLALPGNEAAQSVNPLVAETNDGFLNDIRGRHISKADVFAAIEGAKTGAIEEGSIGAGTGTIAFGWKGGIGTSSRKLPASLGNFTVGVLVQTNFGGVLQIDGAPVGVELGKYYLMDALKKDTARRRSADLNDAADGSIIIVIATDAPVDARNLRRMAARSMMGLARTGAAGTNGSGDYAIAFSAAPELRIKTLNSNEPRKANLLSNDAMSPLFLATIEATEEAIYNSLFRAVSVTGRDKRAIEALPLERTQTILRKYNKIK
ncbi:MAG: D-aminopeptidase [uncultured Pyrinomonadaceae bacterium]|uniref:D-aminopeptidase n=1 Tax=uncultured Pyrinomonadaceae bacterium TaxID=2283094 RepID=A0A6J4PIK8_9BACT|nr:MAG: D-aminopeptidase [uncultured Pyrinomonadaceae bacterium]